MCARVWGGDSLELGRRRGQGNRGGAPSSAPPPSRRVYRGGASSSAPFTMDLRGVGTRLGSRAREAARPRGCAGARAGMAR